MGQRESDHITQHSDDAGVEAGEHVTSAKGTSAEGESAVTGRRVRGVQSNRSAEGE